jgi:2-polyprenyl-3-methyl-5-hydroxy-6-metoxy-1,4-benzoquinol methylase
MSIRRLFGGSRPGRPSAPLRREAVEWAYRLFLGREAERPAVVEEKLARLRTVEELRQDFLGSQEFRATHHGLFVTTLEGDEPRMEVERVSSPADLQALFSHVQGTWETLGETVPYWSVLVREELRSAPDERALERFYETGEADVARLLRTLERSGLDISSFGSCLEYGCGVGRLLPWLARRFATVHGVDVSRHHLDLAARHLSEAGIHNVELVHLRGVEDVTRLPTVDVVFSLIVLQHNPPPVIAYTLAALLRSLAEGGVACFQVPTYRAGYRFSLETYLREHADSREMEMHVLPQSAVFEIAADQGCHVLEVLEDGCTGRRPKEVSNTFLVRKRSDRFAGPTPG